MVTWQLFRSQRFDYFHCGQVSQAEGVSLKQNIFSILILKWHISFCTMPGLNIYIYRYINTPMVDRKYISLTIILHMSLQNFHKRYFAKFLFIRLTPTQYELNGGKKISFTFQSFLMFSSPETSFSASGWEPNQPLIL